MDVIALLHIDLVPLRFRHMGRTTGTKLAFPTNLSTAIKFPFVTISVASMSTICSAF